MESDTYCTQWGSQRGCGGEQRLSGEGHHGAKLTPSEGEASVVSWLESYYIGYFLQLEYKLVVYQILVVFVKKKYKCQGFISFFKSVNISIRG